MANSELYPPPVQIIGPNSGDSDLEDELRQKFESVTTDTEIPHTPELSEQLDNMRLAIADFARDHHGLDLSDRLPGVDQYHIYKSKEDLHAALRSLGEEDLDAKLEGRQNRYGIFIVAQETDFVTMKLLAHETIHRLAQTRAKASRGVDDNNHITTTVQAWSNGFVHRNNVSQKSTFKALDEMFTELTIIDIIESGYWSRRPSLPAPDTNYRVFYPMLCIIGDELLRARSRFTNGGPIQGLRAIESGLLRGDPTVLRPLIAPVVSGEVDINRHEQIHPRAYGREALRKLIHVPHADTTATYVELAQALGLPDAARRIIAIEHDMLLSAQQLRVFQGETDT